MEKINEQEGYIAEAAEMVARAALPGHPLSTRCPTP